MKKATFVMLTFLTFILCLADEMPKVSYLVVEEITAPLQIFYNGKHSGIITEIIKETTQGLAKLEYQVLPIMRVRRNLTSKSDKHWLHYGSSKWVSEDIWRFSTHPVLTVNYTMLTASENGYRKLSDLRGKAVIFIRGFTYPGLEKLIKESGIRVMHVNGYKQGVRAIELGRADGFMGMEIRMLHTMKKIKASKSRFNFIDLSQKIPSYDLYLTFAKNFPAHLYQVIDRRLTNMKKNGRVEKIVESYL